MPENQFNLEQIALLNRCKAACEGLVAERFRIPALPSSLYPYELATLIALDPGERSDVALAHLVVYERQRASGVERLFRVCLMDDLILTRAAEAPRPWLRSLLSYVLAHELIHVVRFCRQEQSYLLPGQLREQEERRVHELTLELLASQELEDKERLHGLWGIDRLSREPVA